MRNLTAQEKLSLVNEVEEMVARKMRTTTAKLDRDGCDKAEAGILELINLTARNAITPEPKCSEEELEFLKSMKRAQTDFWRNQDSHIDDRPTFAHFCAAMWESAEFVDLQYWNDHLYGDGNEYRQGCVAIVFFGSFFVEYYPNGMSGKEEDRSVFCVDICNYGEASESVVSPFLQLADFAHSEFDCRPPEKWTPVRDIAA